MHCHLCIDVLNLMLVLVAISIFFFFLEYQINMTLWLMGFTLLINLFVEFFDLFDQGV